MAIETLPDSVLPARARRGGPAFGFLTATPIIAVATICLVLIVLSAVLAPWLYAPADPRTRLAWFAGATLVAAALAVRAYMTAS